MEYNLYIHMPEENKIPEVRNTETLEFWLSQIEQSKTYLKDYHEQGRKVIDIYRDAGRNKRARLSSSYNILYSNTETMRPVLFSEAPETDVRAQDATSLPAREAAKMLEDVLNYNVKTPETMQTIKSCVEDLLLPGMGVMRVCYKPAFYEETVTRIEIEDETGFEIEVEDQEEKVVFEEVNYEYVHWNDVYFPEYRSWDVLPWLAFRGLYSYDEAVQEFGVSVAGKLEYSQKDKAIGGNQNTNQGNTLADKFGLAEVWEIWDKTNRKVVWISNSKMLHEPIRIDDDPLELDDFYPVPPPLFSITTNDKITPVPLYVQYQDLASELNEISSRIRRIADNLKRRGVYDASMKELQQLQDAGDNQFIGIKNFSQFQNKGGMKAVIDSEDLTQQVAVLNSLYVQRDQIINAIYQIMGYGDILRGVSDPRETATAQRIKGRFGTLRISEYQREVQRFIRDGLRIAGQIVINKYSDKSIALQTSIPIEKVAVYKEILQQNEPSSVMVDVQTDSTIAADDIADKESIIEFGAAIAEFAQRAPVLDEVLGLQATSELLLSMLRKFKMGRDIEQAVLDQVVKVTQQRALAESQPPEPTPEEMLAQVEMAKLQQKAATDNANLQIKVAELQLKERELEIKAAEIGLKDTHEKQRIDLEAVDMAMKQLALSAEAANPNDNAIVGV